MASIQRNGFAVSLNIFRVQDKVFSSGINSQCIQRAKLIADYVICSCHVKKWLEISASSSQRENLRDRHFSWSVENETSLLIGYLSDRPLHPYLCFIRLVFIGRKSCKLGEIKIHTWPFSASTPMKTDLRNRTNKTFKKFKIPRVLSSAVCFIFQQTWWNDTVFSPILETSRETWNTVTGNGAKVSHEFGFLNSVKQHRYK